MTTGSISAIELKYQIKQTEALIDTAGMDITLFRPPALVPDGAGGMKRQMGGDVQQPTVKRYFGNLITMGRGVSTQPERWITTSLGERYREFGILIGLPNDDIREHDYFIDVDGNRWDVLFIHRNEQYQVKAEVGLAR